MLDSGRDSVDGIITINDRGTVQSVCRAAEGMFGYSAEDLVGRNVNVLLAEPEGGNDGNFITRSGAAGERGKSGDVGRLEVEGRRSNGETFPLDLTVSAVELAGGFRDLVQPGDRVLIKPRLTGSPRI